MTSDGRLTKQRIRAGIWTVADMTDDYEIGKLTVPNDGYFDESYWCYSVEGSTPPQPARISDNADGSQSDDGFYNWQSRLPYVTFDALPILWTALGLTNARSADVTVMEYTELNVPVFLTAKVRKPTFPSNEAIAVPNGWSITLVFKTGEIIT